MKKTLVSCILIIIISMLKLQAQCVVDAGVNHFITAEDKVQLKAKLLVSPNFTTLYYDSTTNLNSIQQISDSIIYATTSTGTFFKTTDAGNTWTSSNWGSTNYLAGMLFYNKNIGLAFGINGTISKTTDGGDTWTVLNSASTSSLKGACFISSDTILVHGIGLTNGYLITTDGGQTWNLHTVSGTSSVSKLYFLDKKTGFLSGINQTIFKTTDGGDTWIAQSNPTGISSSGYSFISKETGFAYSTSSTSILKTINGGTSWSAIPIDTVYTEYYDENNPSAGGIGFYSLISSTFNKLKFVTDKIGYICGSKTISKGIYEGFVLKTTNAGKAWKLFYTYNAGVRFAGSDFFAEDQGCIFGSNAYLSKLTSPEPTVDNGTYSWTPLAGLSNPNIANPFAQPTVSTTYYVTRTENSCVSTDSVTVNIVPLTLNIGDDQSIVCSAKIQLQPTLNFSDYSKLKFRWTPSSGLSSDTVANPVATVSSTTQYKLKVTTPLGEMAEDSIRINVSRLSLSSNYIYGDIVSGNKITLSPIITTNYNGNDKITYKWSPSVGVSNDTILNPTLEAKNVTTTYTITAKISGGCSTSATVKINPINMTLDLGDNKTMSCGSLLQLGVVSTNYTGNKLRYKWTPNYAIDNDTIANPVVSPLKNTVYHLIITNQYGSTATDSVGVSASAIANPNIAYVGVSEKNKNVIVWDSGSFNNVVSYNIFRESSIKDVFTKIGSVDFNSSHQFTDTLSNPDIQANIYKISQIDGCGFESALSAYHKTMHLTINKGTNNIWNLIWEPYEGASIATYNVYRGSNKDNITLINSLSGSNSQYSDITVTGDVVFYQVEAVMSAASGIKKENANSSKTVTVYSSRSNIATNQTGYNSLKSVSDISELLTLYPNPTRNEATLDINCKLSGKTSLIIYNSTGQVVSHKQLTDSMYKLDVSTLSKGLYFLEVKNDVFLGKTRLIVQ